MSAQGFRFERKFLIADLAAEWVEALLRVHPAVLRERYPPRFVNNIYFDSPARHSYRDAVEGMPGRRKIRIRWYGDLFGPIAEPRLEVKLKRGYLGRKLSWPLARFELDRDFDRRGLEWMLAASDLPPAARAALHGQEMVLLNRYRRRYYESVRGGYRVTLDTELQFYRVRAWANAFVGRAAPRETVIVELKYAPGEEDRLRDFSAHLPVRLTKSSKYVIGVEGLGA